MITETVESQFPYRAVMDDLDRQILALESRTWRHTGAKQRAVHALGISWNVYLVRVRRLAWDPEAIAAEPAVTRRIRERIQDASMR